MSRQINQPINQVKLTNVAVVKYSHKGKRFEIACYRNKVMDFRSGFERDLSEVLQSDRIFTNVSKGQFAKASDLEQAFGTKDEETIAKLILEKGKFELSDLERQQLLDNTLSQICTMIADNCVHPNTKRPYTFSQIKIALSNFHLQPNKPVKKQYLDAIKFLKQSIPLERAKMELALRYPVGQQEAIQAALSDVPHDTVLSKSGEGVKVIQVDPSLYRQINDLAVQIKGRLEILQQGVVSDAPQGGSTEGSHDLSEPLGLPLQSTSSSELPRPRLDEDDESDEEQQKILSKLQAVGIGRNNDENDNGGAPPLSVSSVKPNRKQLRQQQKKHKKDQRRHEEEAQERSSDSEQDDSQPAPHAAHSSAPSPTEVYASGDARSCNTCGGHFHSAADYRSHFRSDWHRFNQKLKLKGVPPVTEEEFQLCDAQTFFGKDEDDE